MNYDGTVSNLYHINQQQQQQHVDATDMASSTTVSVSPSIQTDSYEQLEKDSRRPKPYSANNNHPFNNSYSTKKGGYNRGSKDDDYRVSLHDDSHDHPQQAQHEERSISTDRQQKSSSSRNHHRGPLPPPPHLPNHNSSTPNNNNHRASINYHHHNDNNFDPHHHHQDNNHNDHSQSLPPRGGTFNPTLQQHYQHHDSAMSLPTITQSTSTHMPSSFQPINPQQQHHQQQQLQQQQQHQQQQHQQQQQQPNFNNNQNSNTTSNPLQDLQQHPYLPYNNQNTDQPTQQPSRPSRKLLNRKSLSLLPQPPLTLINRMGCNLDHIAPIVGILDSSFSTNPASFDDQYEFPDHSQLIQTTTTSTTQTTTTTTSSNLVLNQVPFHTYQQLQQSHLGIWLRCGYMYQYIKQLQHLCDNNNIGTPKFTPPIHPSDAISHNSNESRTGQDDSNSSINNGLFNCNVHTLYDWHYDQTNIERFEQFAQDSAINPNSAQFKSLPLEEQVVKLQSKVNELQMELETTQEILTEMDPIVNQSQILDNSSTSSLFNKEYNTIEQYEHYVAQLETKIASLLNYIESFKHNHTYSLVSTVAPPPSSSPFIPTLSANHNESDSHTTSTTSNNTENESHVDKILPNLINTSSLLNTSSLSATTTMHDHTNNLDESQLPDHQDSLNPDQQPQEQLQEPIFNYIPLLHHPTPNYFVRSTFALQDVCKALSKQVINLSRQLESVHDNALTSQQQIQHHQTTVSNAQFECEKLLQLVDLVVLSSTKSHQTVSHSSQSTNSSSRKLTSLSRRTQLTSKQYSSYLQLQNRIFNTVHQLYTKYPIFNAQRLTTLVNTIPAQPAATTSTASTTPSLQLSFLPSTIRKHISSQISSLSFNNSIKNQVYRFFNHSHVLNLKLHRTAKESASSQHKLTKAQDDYNRLFVQSEQLQKQLNKTNQNKANASKSELDDYQHKLMCSICSIREKSCCIDGCGHTLCMTCMDESLRARNRKCPICAVTISSSQVHGMRL
jgi:hypothetical protein